MSRRPYLTTRTLTELRRELSANEWGVLLDVSVMRVASATDLQRLQGLRAPMSVRGFRRQLAGLSERLVLFRLERTIGGRASGSAGFIYAVGPAGQHLLTAEGRTDRARRPWTPRPTWLSHALSAGHLYVVLRELEAAGRIALEQFQTEPTCWREFDDSDGKVTLKPDAFVRVEGDEYVDSYFVEVDCATESPNTLARKMTVYRRYLEAGVEQGAHGVFPQVLWLVPSDARRTVVARVVERTQGAAALHRVSTYDNAAAVFSGLPP